MLAVPAIQMMTFDYYSTRSTFVAFPTRCGAACYRNVILCQSSACKAALIPAITLMVLFRALKSAITIFSSRNENERTGKRWALMCLEWKVNSTFRCHLKNIICQLEAERRQKSFCCSREEKSIAKKVEDFTKNFFFDARQRKLKVCQEEKYLLAARKCIATKIFTVASTHRVSERQ